jgi:hypothetical protein
MSLVLAAGGIVFAYYVSLPASLYFLTGFNLYHINPMLTIDSYFSFVMTYLLAGALLFQLPLVMMIINSVKPLTPKKLMKAQDKIIIGSFIVAAVISPTPDALNQILLASPMVVMYQLGIVMIWLKNRKSHKKAKRASRELAAKPAQIVKRTQPATADISFDDMISEFAHLQSPVKNQTPSPSTKPTIAQKTPTDSRQPARISSPRPTVQPVSKPVLQPTPQPVVRLQPSPRVRSGQFTMPARPQVSPFATVTGRNLDGVIMTRRA